MPKGFSEWPPYRVKPAAIYCNAKFAQVASRNTNYCASRILIVANVNCESRYVASLKFSSGKETVGGLPQLRGEIEVFIS